MSVKVCLDEDADLLSLAPREFSLRLGVAIPLHGDFRNGVLDVPAIVGRELDRRRADVLFEAVELGGAGDRDDPWLLRQQPGERDLRGRHALLAPDLFQETDHGLVRLAGLRREARQGAAIVVAAEGRSLVDLAGEKAPAQRTVGGQSRSPVPRKPAIPPLRADATRGSIRFGQPRPAGPNSHGHLIC